MDGNYAGSHALVHREYQEAYAKSFSCLAACPLLREAGVGASETERKAPRSVEKTEQFSDWPRGDGRLQMEFIKKATEEKKVRGICQQTLLHSPHETMQTRAVPALSEAI